MKSLSINEIKKFESALARGYCRLENLLFEMEGEPLERFLPSENLFVISLIEKDLSEIVRLKRIIDSNSSFSDFDLAKMREFELRFGYRGYDEEEE